MQVDLFNVDKHFHIWINNFFYYLKNNFFNYLLSFFIQICLCNHGRHKNSYWQLVIKIEFINCIRLTLIDVVTNEKTRSMYNSLVLGQNIFILFPNPFLQAHTLLFIELLAVWILLCAYVYHGLFLIQRMLYPESTRILIEAASAARTVSLTDCMRFMALPTNISVASWSSSEPVKINPFNVITPTVYDWSLALQIYQQMPHYSVKLFQKAKELNF